MQDWTSSLYLSFLGTREENDANIYCLFFVPFFPSGELHRGRKGDVEYQMDRNWTESQ